VDTADPPRPDSGSGALATITFTALAPGTAEIQFAQLDVDRDGVLDIGPLLRDVDLKNLGANADDGDIFFDGQWTPIEARIGGGCDGAAPTGTGNGGPGTGGGGGDGGGIGEVALIALAAGAVALVGTVLAGGRYILRRLNRSAA
jgi:hypothetical protein